MRRVGEKNATRNAGGWLLALAVLTLFAAGCEKREERRSPPPPLPVADAAGLIVAMGDSLTAGLGVAPAEAWPALLQEALTAEGLNFRVINAGVSGETSSGARARTDWVLSFRPDIVILATGGNDGLRGIDPALTRRNIAETVALLQEARVTVLLCGMRMVRNMGEEFNRAYAAIYPTVATETGVVFMPFLLEGVAMRPALNQSDAIHPNPAGHRVIAANLLPHLREAISRHRRQPPR
ncbi:MAG: arylesterase [Thermodesulfobacteriota bacterium]